MYLQITTRCNMTCAHCGMNCTAKGKDMSMKVVRAALKMFPDDHMSLGGGEPTIHPKFWEIFGICLGSSESLWMATNGSIPSIAIPLANLAKKGVLGVALSQDIYHDPIDGEVIQAFIKKGFHDRNSNDAREIRNTEESLINAGRCDFGHDACICEGTFIEPDGYIRQCGCVDSPIIGNVLTGEIDYDMAQDVCHKEYKK